MPDWNPIIFDFDYTLADSSSGVVVCAAHALSAMGREQRDEVAVRRTIGLSLAETYRALTGRDDPDEGAEFHRIFVEKADEIMNAKTFLLDGVPETIRRLERAGLTMAIVSTKYAYRIRGVLEREALLDVFEFVVGGEQVAYHKPHPESLLLAIDKLGGRTDRMLYVGDSVTDAETAKRAGLPFVGVHSGPTTREALAVWPHLDLLASVNALPDWLGIEGS